MDFKLGDFVRYSFKGFEKVFVVTSVGIQSSYDNPEVEEHVLYDGEWDYRNDEPEFYFTERGSL